MMRARRWARCAGARALAALLALAASGAVTRLHAQYDDIFGENAVQYRQFDWRVLETEHFLIHYYPQERAAAYDAARLAERDYARLSRILGHQFREKKPILLFASRSDFGQNNVTGDLGEGTSGVTEPLRQRIILPFSGDYHSFEHVLTHEMVHEFQFDIFGRGRAGGNLQLLERVNPPLWFMEGMAEYLSKGPNDPLTSMWMRDAVLNGRFPTIQDMQRYPERYFPYRYGESLWAYIGARWGDDIIGRIMAQVPSAGIDRAFRAQLGMSLDDLGEEWREAMQTRYLPPVALLQRPRKFSQPLLNPRKTGGGNPFFIAPALSNDGRYITFIATGSFLRGEVFPDIWLGDGRTGKRIKRLVKSTLNSQYTELQLIYTQSAFSLDGRFLAFTALTGGRQALYLLDVRRRKVVKRFETIHVDVNNPAWSPDGQTIVFSGMKGGFTDLYTVDVAGGAVRQLTDDRYGDLQPQWSPDGRTIAFASERGPDASFETLHFPLMRICLYDVATGQITVLPGQRGLNINPMWAPDGQSIAYVSDRTGTANIFLYDLPSKQQYQLTNVVGGISAITEVSPAITWAREADRLAFAYYQQEGYTVWSIDNPRALRGEPFRDTTAVPLPVLAQREADSSLGRALPGQAADTSASGLASQQSFYRGANGIRPSDAEPTVTPPIGGGPVTVAQMLDSARLALPDSTRFKDRPYKTAYQIDYIAQPNIGYVNGGYYSGLYGGTTVFLSDLVGNSQLAFSGAVNGSFNDAQLFAAYTNLGHRIEYSVGAYAVPYYFYSSDQVVPGSTVAGANATEQLVLTRYAIRQAFGIAYYPINRFARWEFGLRYNNVDRSNYFLSSAIDTVSQTASGFGLDSIRSYSQLNYAQPYVALVSDNTLFGATGPISGRRFRLQVEPAVGSYQWMEYLVDYRRYFPILFDFLTVATRVESDLSIGRDESAFPKYIASPYFLRGYDRYNPLFNSSCGSAIASGTGASEQTCNSIEGLGSRYILGNAELRFPLIRRIDLGVVPISLPPVDGLFFYDIGSAWSKGQTLYFSAPANYNPATERYFLSSYGAGLRLNLYGIAILRWDYAIPVDAGRKGYWRWSIGPSF